MKPRRNVTQSHTNTHTHTLKSIHAFVCFFGQRLNTSFSLPLVSEVAGALGELCGCVDMSWPTALWESWAWEGLVSIHHLKHHTQHAHELAIKLPFL